MITGVNTLPKVRYLNMCVNGLEAIDRTEPVPLDPE